MTGFGRSELKSAQGHIRVEIKTVNHKFFEISARLPNHLGEFEDLVRKTVGQEVRRGKINVFVSSPDPAVVSTRLKLNEPLAKEVHINIQRLKNILKIKSDDNAVLREVLRYPEVLSKDTSFYKEQFFSKQLVRAVTLALGSLKNSRLQEGRALDKDFRRRLVEIKKALAAIEKRLPAIVKEYKKSFESKSKEFLKNGEIDRERLTLEVALFMKNSDISEEVTRLKSHLDAMRKSLGETGELGRKIDFIAQEMYRESNTMGAKSSDVVIANSVIQIKSTIEKIREQAQNVE